MTDSSDPTAPKSSRKKQGRQPATIDVKPTVVDDGTRPADSVSPAEDTLTPSADTLAGTDAVTLPDAASSDTSPSTPDTTLSESASLEGVSDPSVSVDGGAGIDAIASDSSPPGATPIGASASERPPSGSRFGQLVGAGLVGGLLGGGIVLGVQAVVPFAHEDRRIDALEQRINALPANGSEALAGRLSALERVRTNQRDDIRDLRAGLAQIRAGLQEVQNRPAAGAPADGGALTDLTNRLAALESGVQNGAQSSQAAAQAVGQKLDEQAGQLAQRLETQGQQIAAIDQRLSQLSAQWDQRLSQIDGRLGQQDGRIGGFEQRIGGQDGRLAALAQQATEGASATTRAGVAVTLSERLADALRTGAPYGGLLDALRKVGVDPARLGPLEAFAASGAPTSERLAETFKPVGDAIIRDSRAGAEGWNDRLMRMVDRVVTVRPVDQPGATGVPSIVARIGEALDRGDVRAALAAWETLPEPSRRLSEDWAREARARASADDAAQAVASDALASLTRTVQ